ncbi:hypothetical protein N7533_013438 [Penicillium manginii]|uniref:uncharacterized protein n=1 Tax=Penicillium manginii TaxID=203109 RepID=UPI002548C443|nr:uncharacterized protein N7533_013438 [Penicillium manginii]KAJ5732991.1 hypothetical protein N7533_013438 [Penicillium manginii]
MLQNSTRRAMRLVGRPVRFQPRTRVLNRRFQSSSSGSASSGGNSALVGGIAGGAFACTVGYAWYYFSGAKTLIDSNTQAKQYIQQAKQKFSETAPEPNEAYSWLKKTVNRYAVFIPGAREYADTAFKDLETIRDKHGEEFDEVVKDAYNELKDLSKDNGFNTDTAFQGFYILQKHMNRLLDLAGDAGEDILNNHPQLKEKVGGSIDQLKEMGESYGPQAKEEVNKIWSQISDIVKRGASLDTAAEIKKLIDEKREKLQKLGDEAWQKGLDESRKYLEKNDKLKALIDENAETLKKGNFQDLWGLLKESASSGKTENVEKFIKEKLDQAKQGGGGALEKMEKWLKAAPGGSNILQQLQTLQNAADKKGNEAEEVLKETFEEIQDVLKKRKEQVEKIAKEGDSGSS